MVMKGTVQTNHIPKNNYELIILGIPPLVLTEISGLEQETEKSDMPDRTVVSGGNVKATEFTAKTFEHHTIELAAMELWRLEATGNVSPLYKKVGTLIKRNIDGSIGSTRTLSGVWITKRTDDDLELANEGEPVMIEWTFSVDDVLSI